VTKVSDPRLTALATILPYLSRRSSRKPAHFSRLRDLLPSNFVGRDDDNPEQVRAANWSTNDPDDNLQGGKVQLETARMPNLTYLSLGSNVGERDKNLQEAIHRLKTLGSVLSVSSFYETEPVEFTEQPWFLNCAVALETSQPASQLMSGILEIEHEMGRLRVQKKGPRSIDIDILLFGDEIVNTPDLTIPHPAMAERRFVLEPLAEIADRTRHPALRKTIGELLHDLPAGQTVRKIKTG
jgi:2-amino-4-hydroxy-6-hydroxymethyldihydropteridine diphosphokinase